MADEKNTGVFVQNSCLQHRYIRSKDLSTIVERPERLRAVNIGLSAAIARLEELFLAERNATDQSHPVKDETTQNDLIDDMSKLSLSQSFPKSPGASSPVTITNSQATVDLLNHPAVKFIHGDIERDIYLENLRKWAAESVEKIKNGESEIPDNFFQGDLYCTCPYTALRTRIDEVSMPRIDKCHSGRCWNRLRSSRQSYLIYSADQQHRNFAPCICSYSPPWTSLWREYPLRILLC